MEKEICFTVAEVDDKYVKLYTKSSIVSREGLNELKITKKSLFQFMKTLSNKYNNHPRGCIGVSFDVE